MSARRLLGRGLVGLALVAPAWLVAGSPAHASGYPPITQPDAVTVTIDGREAHLDLAANDVDPEGESVRFAGTDGNLPHGVRIVDGSKGTLQDTVVFASAFPGPTDPLPPTPGTYQVRTYMSDGSSLTASILTITVLPSPGDAVHLTKKHRPGRVVVHNDNDTAIRFVWGAQDHQRADGRVDVPAHGSRKVMIQRRSVITVVLAGPEFAIGIERHLRPPRDGTALPPGLEHGTDVFHARLTKWVQKAIFG